ncbi:MAG: tRNA dihydrouridine synthase DusB [Ruminococcaceae bacterium]|nr:tRNA dihydrouridine synthase DusB [Oscillospiraceae bacterium]
MDEKITAALAPMAGFTDVVFRRICGEMGADYTISEMISSVAMCMKDEKTAALAAIGEGEAPCFLQIFGHDPVMMARSAEMLLSRNFKGCRYAAQPRGIDINMGCPVRKVTSNGDGSAMMRNIENAVNVAARVAEVCAGYGAELSVKMRAGWDSDSVNAPELAYALASVGVRRLICHCRTKEQLYGPGADPAVIKAVVDAVREFDECVVVGNGDIASYADGVRMMETTGCHEVMIGRAALGNPWLFREFKGESAEKSLDEIIDMACRMVREVVAEKGEHCGIRESRGRAAHFIRGIPGSAKIRDRLNHALTLREFESALRGG